MAESGGVFARTTKGLVAMKPQPYEAEATLQRLLAETPDLLSGDGEEMSWLFVGREVAVADAPDAAGRWSLDHLFLDADGIPTLVEVKRSSNTQIRREIVGQMFDYAANARHSWASNVRALFEARSEDPAAELKRVFGEEVNPDDYWRLVEENLSEGRLRLVFVADQIPRELRSIVEFLNEQMTKTEVLAVEVRQFLDENGGHQMLVSRLIGRTQAADDVKGGRKRTQRWSRDEWFAALEEQRPEDLSTVQAIFAWAEQQELKLTFGTGAQNASAMFSVRGLPRTLLYVYLSGSIDVSFELLKRQPAYASDAARSALLDHLNALPGVEIPPDKVWPSLPLRALRNEESRQRFLDLMTEVIGRIRGESA